MDTLEERVAHVERRLDEQLAIITEQTEIIPGVTGLISWASLATLVIREILENENISQSFSKEAKSEMLTWINEFEKKSPVESSLARGFASILRQKIA